MLYYITVHYETDKWVPIQLYYINKFTKCDFRIFACLPSIKGVSDGFYFISDYNNPNLISSMNLADKLNYLSSEVFREAKNEDLIIFMHGDAFPVADFLPFVKEKIKKHRLVAIRRDENNGDKQPHTSFCATTVGFWKTIEGDWSQGYQWKDKNGAFVTDSGGNLLKKLETVKWYPLLRTNKKNLHPLWFGIYHNMIYHHGAGFRPPVSRIDLATSGMDQEKFLSSDNYRANLNSSEVMFNKIIRDKFFYKELLEDRSFKKRFVEFMSNLYDPNVGRS